MRAVRFSKARGEFAELLDEVVRDRVAVEIVRPNKPSVILIDKHEYDSMLETLHLMSSSANAKRLTDAIANVEAGSNLVYHDLIEN